MRPDFISDKISKGQVLSFDVMIASALLVIVLAVILTQVGYSVKGYQEFKEKSAIMNDLDKLSGIFFDEGFPKNWTSENVRTIGFEKNGRIDMDKLSNFTNISYSKNLILLGLNSDYNITLYHEGNPIYSFGKSYENATSIFKKERISVLENGSLVTIRVLVFRT
jgi:hypothetical protein